MDVLYKSTRGKLPKPKLGIHFFLTGDSITHFKLHLRFVRNLVSINLPFYNGIIYMPNIRLQIGGENELS